MNKIASLFPETYEASRARFRDDLAAVQSHWPQAQLFRRCLSGDEDLSIDWIYADALKKNEKVFLLTTGEHGVEAYVGSAMLQRFLELYLPRLNPENTGVLFVHIINPWGMKYHRRVNANNVDLNRNFVYDEVYDPLFNPDYDTVNRILNPTTAIRSLGISNLIFKIELIWHLARVGVTGFHNASLPGQYRYPEGLYFGGISCQEETQVLIQLYKQVFSEYEQILHLDMHTGYGPRYQMSLVNSVFEIGGSQEFEIKFNYPVVVAANPEEFYAIRGDMIDYVYSLWKNEYPEKRMFATAFEFGTLGNEFFSKVHCPVAMVHENRLHWYGAKKPAIEAQVKGNFEELFNPGATDWQAKAVADADQAFEGILKAEGYIPK
jgi:hypothetical protein